MYSNPTERRLVIVVAIITLLIVGLWMVRVYGSDPVANPRVSGYGYLWNGNTAGILFSTSMMHTSSGPIQLLPSGMVLKEDSTYQIKWTPAATGRLILEAEWFE